MVLVVHRILNTCVLVFVLCLWSVQAVHGSFFVEFNLWIGPGFILESSSSILIFNSYFLVPTLRQDLFSSAYLNTFTGVLWPVTESSSIYGVHHIRCFLCLKKEAESASET
jgi:hypothetical protein